MAKTQWHPAFCAAMRLELKNNPALQFINEFNLTEKPLEVDMLIIHKPSDVTINSGIGEFFRKHSLVEYARKLVSTAYRLKENEDRRLAEAIVRVLTSANESLFKKIKEDDIMASALMELMKPEVEEYAKEYAKERVREDDMEHAAIMIQRGEDNEYIKLLTHLTDMEIDSLRELK